MYSRMLNGKRILLGVTGGIAAYKSPLLVREFIKAGAEVQVVMTRSAAQFVTPLALATVSKRDVVSEMFPPPDDPNATSWTKHIDLGLWADIMLVAPATAHTLARIAHGFADDMLTTLALALRCPLALAPAMDVDMFLNKTTQQNIDILKESGCFVIDPEEGELASGLVGPGRLPEIDRLVAFVNGILDKIHLDLTGKKILVTAGPTQEPIDPVRYIGNRSSGKMGFAIANVAALRGAEVTLVSGPVHLRTPRSVRRIDVRTAEEMKTAVDREFEHADAVIMSAAVADYTVVNPNSKKIKRENMQADELTLSLKQNPDILKSLGEKKQNRILVGFALETHDGIENARKKLNRKNLDLIVLNNPNEPGAGFNSDTNVVTFLTPDGQAENLPLMSKFDVANRILDRVKSKLTWSV
ncbi:MAG: bifunctional phosphopantothenoylcysteine decarboxylase/phosphopantothenate--cysteine ligase CoaBC [Bacteroidetes bacterium]|nr:bifunctional phosphopantothenoylcysteine decarboxylase/phosphopantothenate--cysteine ligase CoaBC [Bacteroidota bacterium]MCW5895882.1 bifunctional phosphopantothenoylcysteine decarboxylase/phosphopantothenate--cysteine ligase CoaBC [Bacteroidota bacterium]